MMMNPSKEELAIYKKMDVPGLTDKERLMYEEQLKALWEKEREKLKDCPFAH